jgi:hypothetical protein
LLEDPDTFFSAGKFEKQGLGKDGSGDQPECQREIGLDHIVLNFDGSKM